jgi:putative MFS transporter
MSSLSSKDKSDDDQLEYTVEDAIESYGVGRSTIICVCICGFYWSADACEMMLMSFILPAVRLEFGISSTLEALVASFVFFGVATGTFVWGFVADRVGRRPVVCITALLSGLVGAASAFAPNIYVLLAMRFVLGVVLGGAPVAFALTSEFVAARLRGRLMIYYNLFWTFGTVGESILAFYVMPYWGEHAWRYLLALSSVPCMIVGVCAYPLLFESPRYLFTTGRKAGWCCVS